MSEREKKTPLYQVLRAAARQAEMRAGAIGAIHDELDSLRRELEREEKLTETQKTDFAVFLKSLYRELDAIDDENRDFL